MISRFLTTEDELTFLDINEIQNKNTLIISIDETINQDGYLSVSLTKDDINDLIKVLRNKVKEME